MSPAGGTGVSRYTASGLPPGLVIGSTSGVISGTPTAANTATAAVTVTAADTGGNPDTVALTFPAVAAEQIEVMIDGNPFVMTILYRPNNIGVTVNTLSVEG